MQTDVVLIALADVTQDARTLNLARALSHAGVRTTVIAASTSESASEPFTLVPWPRPNTSALRQWRSLNAFVRGLHLEANVVIAMDLFALNAAASVHHRRTLIYDMREFYFALGPLQGRGLKQRVIEAHERWMLRKVDIVLVSGPLDATIVRDHYRLENEPHVILNVPPFKERVESDILRKHHGIADVDCIVLYQGVVHHGRGIAPFMKSMVHVHDVHLCIVGDGPAVADLQLLSAELDVADRVHWHGAVSYDDLHDVTCSADVGLCLIEPVSKSYEYALPNKLFEYMMAGLPVLATDLPALRMQLGQTPVGMLVERTLKTTSIVAALQQVRVPATYEGMRDACRAIRDLSYERQAQYIIDLVRVGT